MERSERKRSAVRGRGASASAIYARSRWFRLKGVLCELRRGVINLRGKVSARDGEAEEGWPR
jgi:hypothetical protein